MSGQPSIEDQLQTRAIHELVHTGRYLTPTDVVGVIERFHASEGPGVPRETITAYVTEVFQQLGQRSPLTLEQFTNLLENRVTELDMWLPNTLYEVAPGRLSTYPARWNKQLTGTQDPVPYVNVISEDVAAARGLDADRPVAPVPKRLLIDAMITFGDLDRPTANRLITEGRLAGRIVVEPFQNPDADVWLGDTAHRPK